MKMEKSIILLLLSLAFSSSPVFASVDCDRAVENQIEITKASIDKSKPSASFILKSLNTPGARGKGVKQCEQDIKSDKGVKEWSCVQHAKSMKDIQSCD
tara:strand:+ start:195 stop:491 length:297 start_codon:yes stop_codon:yes gene_type:complete